jgi:hypothetical protein
MAPVRNVPRDLYDLHHLWLAKADPCALLRDWMDDAQLLELRATAASKIEAIDHRRAAAELLPYLPPAQRARLDEDAWLELSLIVCAGVEEWAAAAQALPKPTSAEA